MAARPETGSSRAADRARLSAEASRFFADVFISARKGSLAELRRCGCSEEEAEEFFANAFAKVLGSVDPVARGFSAAQMVNFIKRAAWRVMLDERRRRGLRPEVELSAIHSLSDGSAESPEEVAEEREAVAIGREALQTLSDRDRLIFRQRNQLDLSPEEIMRRTPGLSLRTYRKIIQRANTRVLAAFERIESGERCQEMESSLLRRYIAEDCQEEEQLAVEVHLAHCRACQLAYGRMRGHLLEVASTLVVAISVFAPDRSGALDSLAARAIELASDGAHGMISATRSARERVRDLLFRIAGGVPGAGGDATFGQALSATSVKVASACAAGVAAGACFAAGVVPGIAGIGSLQAPTHQAKPVLHTAPDVAPTLEVPVLTRPTPESRQAPSGSSQANKGRPLRGRHRRIGRHSAVETRRSSAPPREAPSSGPSVTELDTEAGGEFGGAEAGQPVAPPPTSTTSPGASSRPSGSGTDPAQSRANSVTDSGGEEFGL